jgi:hypothetical protein
MALVSQTDENQEADTPETKTCHPFPLAIFGTIRNFRCGPENSAAFSTSVNLAATKFSAAPERVRLRV